MELLNEYVLLRYEPLVKRVVDVVLRKFPAYYGVTRADLMQEGIIALLFAAKRFDPDKGRFSSYAWVVVTGAVLRSLLSGVVPVVPETDCVEVLEDVRCALLSLDEKECYVLVYSYGLEGRDYLGDNRIAENLGMGETEVVRTRLRAIAKMRGLMRE